MYRKNKRNLLKRHLMVQCSGSSFGWPIVLITMLFCTCKIRLEIASFRSHWSYSGIWPKFWISICARVPWVPLIFNGLQWRIQDFPEEGALTPEGGRQPIIWSIFPENCMKMKKFWARGGGTRPSRPPLDPPLGCDHRMSKLARFCQDLAENDELWKNSNIDERLRAFGTFERWSTTFLKQKFA